MIRPLYISTGAKKIIRFLYSETFGSNSCVHTVEAAGAAAVVLESRRREAEPKAPWGVTGIELEIEFAWSEMDGDTYRHKSYGPLETP